MSYEWSLDGPIRLTVGRCPAVDDDDDGSNGDPAKQYFCT